MLDDAVAITGTAPVDPHRIMIVEDDLDVAEMMRDGLMDQAEYDIACCGNGQKALDMITHGWVPELIFMDLKMPIMDGTTCIRHLRANPVTTTIPMIAISAEARMKQELDELVQVAGILPKPFTIIELSLACAFWLKKGQAA